MFLKVIRDIDQENLCNFDHFERATDPKAAIVMGVAVFKESSFQESRFCQTITKAKKVNISIITYNQNLS